MKWKLWKWLNPFKRSISLKLAAATTVMFTLMVGVLFIGQILFLEQFFIAYKVGQVKKEIIHLQTQYRNEQWAESDIVKGLNEFTSKNALQAAILDQNGYVKYKTAYSITIESEAYGKVLVPLTNTIYLEGFKNIEFKEGDVISLEGLMDNTHNEIFSIFNIQNGKQSWTNLNNNTENAMLTQLEAVPVSADAVMADQANVAESGTAESIQSASISTAAMSTVNVKALKEVRLEGVITELAVPASYDSLSPYSDTDLLTAIDRWNYLRTQNVSDGEVANNQLVDFEYENPLSGLNSRIFVIRYTVGNAAEYFFVNLSLRPIDDAVGAVKFYYLIGFGFALLPIVLLSLFFSKMITRPLVVINKTAGRFEQMDFSVQCDLNSEDEMGTLAKRLNLMSEKLSDSMAALKETNFQLQEEIKKEKSLETMRKEFIAGVSHEFKTPLSIIKAYTEGIANSPTSEKRNFYTEVLMNEVEKMDELVLDLLELSRLESGSYQLKPERFMLSELIDLICIRFKKLIEEKKLTLNQVTIEEWVEADYRKIEQVISNFVSNAIRHVNEGGLITISVTLKNQQVMIMVENTGSSIDELEKDKIWDRFYRIESSRDKKLGGTGLGLSIAKNILELHHSAYGVENTDQGVLFYFTLECSNEHNNS